MKPIRALAVLGLLALFSPAQAASIITVYNKSTDTAVTTLPHGTATTTYERSGGTVTARTTFQHNGGGSSYQPTGAGGYRPMGAQSGGSSYNPMGSR
jgi:hypothetical protein